MSEFCNCGKGYEATSCAPNDKEAFIALLLLTLQVHPKRNQKHDRVKAPSARRLVRGPFVLASYQGGALKQGLLF